MRSGHIACSGASPRILCGTIHILLSHPGNHGYTHLLLAAMLSCVFGACVALRSMIGNND